MIILFFIYGVFVIAAVVIIWALISRSPQPVIASEVITLIALLASPIVGYKLLNHAHALLVVPDALGVKFIAYRKEESWGWGPGGNEAGIRSFRLPAETASAVQSGGIGFLSGLPRHNGNSKRGWRGNYDDWGSTPIVPSERWRPSSETGQFEVYDYVCRYGFCIDIDKAMLEEVTSAVNSPGSFYAYARIGLIVVSPSNRRVYYLYNG